MNDTRALPRGDHELAQTEPTLDRELGSDWADEVEAIEAWASP